MKPFKQTVFVFISFILLFSLITTPIVSRNDSIIRKNLVNSSSTHLSQSHNAQLNTINLLASEETAFSTIYGSPGHTALAISEEDNVIFTNSHKGLAVIQLDDLTNRSDYGIEIGLSESHIIGLAIDIELKLLYIETIISLDVLNYSRIPYEVEFIAHIGLGSLGFSTAHNMYVDPSTHYLWVAAPDTGLYIYDPINEKQVDHTEFDIPSDGLLAIDQDEDNEIFYFGSTSGIYALNTTTNTTTHFSTDDGMAYNFTRLVKHSPEYNRLFFHTVDDSEEMSLSGGLSVIFLNNNTVHNYTLTTGDFNPMFVSSLVLDPLRDYGYVASFYTPNAECGLYIFNITTMQGITRSQHGAGSSTLPFLDTDPYIEGLLATSALINSTREIVIGTVRRIQILDFDPEGTSNLTQSPIEGLAHNIASDVNYDPQEDKLFISTLLGLNRVDPHTKHIELLIEAPGSGGSTAGELLIADRLMFHHRYQYNITAGNYSELSLPFDEYGHIKDISSSPNDTLIYYSVGSKDPYQSPGGSNGSLIIYNRITENYTVHNFGFNKSLLTVEKTLHDPSDDLLYVATNLGLVIFNLETLEVEQKYFETEGNIKTVALIEGKIWIGLDTHPLVRIYDPTTKTFEDFSHSSSWIPTVNDIYYIPTRNEIFFSTNRGLYAYNRTNNLLKWEGEEHGLSTYFISRMDYCSTNSKLYIGSLLGLNIYKVNFDNVSPELSVYGISEEEKVSGNITITAQASDYSGIKSISMTIQGIEYNTSTDELIVTLDTTNYVNGYYQLNFIAQDNNGLSIGQLIPFQIYNIPEDDIAPTIQDIVYSPSSPTDDDQISITAHVTDNVELENVKLYYRTNEENWQHKAMTADGSIYSTTIGPFEAETTIEFYIFASDTSGNVVESETISFEIEHSDETQTDQTTPETEETEEEMNRISFAPITMISLSMLIGGIIVHTYNKKMKRD